MWPATRTPTWRPGVPCPRLSRCFFPFRPLLVSFSVLLPGEKAEEAGRGRFPAPVEGVSGFTCWAEPAQGVARCVCFLEQQLCCALGGRRVCLPPCCPTAVLAPARPTGKSWAGPSLLSKAGAASVRQVSLRPAQRSVTARPLCHNARESSFLKRGRDLQINLGAFSCRKHSVHQHPLIHPLQVLVIPSLGEFASGFMAPEY